MGVVAQELQQVQWLPRSNVQNLIVNVVECA